MTNDQLRAFVAVVEQGSFRAAANHIHKTQPSVSAAVATLEQQFDFQLFSRDSYRPSLTTEGKAFYRQAKQLLGRVNELEALGHHLARGTVPTLSISLSAMCTLPPGLEQIRRFADRQPQLQLNITTEHLSGVVEKLIKETADLAIGPYTGLDDRFEYVEISRLTMITVARPDLLNLPEEASVPQALLRNRPHILLSDTGSVAPFDHINVLPGGQRWYVGDYMMKKSLLMAGMGWARIPQQMVEAELNSGELTALKVENFNYRSQVPIYLIRLRDQARSGLAKEFWQQMLQLDEG
ncbi:LysR family transcriptional regulator [Motiliproteus coralliicola]|uniref:LysR family transcriptional regulator n=1 Tax=Motiliproteus coralliicola TaxID=2283196 RepID=A0A369WEQ7_9GAMM|nr:LysR family transcriptional regulator [Motiliproteus coralliicola]RDE19831.1 LysR family transcriptional regulator [Motiliproteus coralliicola]